MYSQSACRARNCFSCLGLEATSSTYVNTTGLHTSSAGAPPVGCGDSRASYTRWVGATGVTVQRCPKPVKATGLIGSRKEDKGRSGELNEKKGSLKLARRSKGKLRRSYRQAQWSGRKSKE